MSRICFLCGKSPTAGQNVSHSKRRTKRRFLPNLIRKKFGAQVCRICASCLRSLHKAPKT